MEFDTKYTQRSSADLSLSTVGTPRHWSVRRSQAFNQSTELCLQGIEEKLYDIKYVRKTGKDERS